MPDITQQLRFAVAVEINFAFEPKVNGIVSFLELLLLKLFDFLHQVQCSRDLILLFLRLLPDLLNYP